MRSEGFVGNLTAIHPKSQAIGGIFFGVFRINRGCFVEMRAIYIQIHAVGVSLCEFKSSVSDSRAVCRRVLGVLGLCVVQQLCLCVLDGCRTSHVCVVYVCQDGWPPFKNKVQVLKCVWDMYIHIHTRRSIRRTARI